MPPRASSLRKTEWWARPADRRYALQEQVKLQVYRVILSMPDRIIRWIMRLKS